MCEMTNGRSEGSRRSGLPRLSGYWYPFRDKSDDPGKPDPSTFSNGTTLDEVVEIYCFDERLRAKLFTAIARIEVALRFWVGNRLGRRGPFAHTGRERSSIRPGASWRREPAITPTLRLRAPRKAARTTSGWRSNNE